MEGPHEAGKPARQIIPVVGDSAVHVGRGLLERIPAEVTADARIKASRYVIVSDENVWPLYGQRLVDAFLALGGVTLVGSGSFRGAPSNGAVTEDADGKLLMTYVVRAGEDTKCREVKAAIEDFMLHHRCNRDSCMLALGGGVVGDLVGFVAATYMRGVPVVQIPTSSMAMIDSSVGGKTAINVPAGKNLIGAFHQPVLVYADMDLLASLGRRELVEGIVEAIKMGCIRYQPLFDLLEANPERVMALDGDLITQVIYDAVRMKAEVVALDEKESGVRATLNFGHTVGHAVEALKSPAMLHGECVSVGCAVECELSLRMGNDSLTREKIKRITDCLASYGLPVHMPGDLDNGMLMNKMSMDKKNKGNSIRCTIVTDIGVSIADPQPVDKALMQAVMAESMAEGKARPAWTPHEGKVAVREAGGQMAAAA